MALFVRSGLSASQQEMFECSCCEFMVAKILGQRLNCYLFVVYPSPNTDNRVFECLCEATESIQSVGPNFVFCFVGDLEWLGSLATDAHCVAVFDFATVNDCSQLVIGPTHIGQGVSCNVNVQGNVGGRIMCRLGGTLNLSPTVAGFDVARRVPSSQELPGMEFVRLYLDLLEIYFQDSDHGSGFW